MTLLEIQTLISEWADDKEFGYFTKTALKSFINNAYIKVFKLLVLSGNNWWLREVQGSFIPGQDDYLLPVDCFQVRKIETYVSLNSRESRLPLNPITLSQRDAVSRVGEPRFYNMKNKSFVVAPSPDVQRYVSLHYIYTPALLTGAGSSPDLPEEFHEMIAVLAAIDCFIKDGRDHQMLLDKKNEYLADIKRDSTERVTQGPREVRSTDFDSVGYF